MLYKNRIDELLSETTQNGGLAVIILIKLKNNYTKEIIELKNNSGIVNRKLIEKESIIENYYDSQRSNYYSLY